MARIMWRVAQVHMARQIWRVAPA
ncbi:hypothetical protein A2U01_0093725, partial [Trifolium medium]|nr:hypothetical protein [Trifolium medium]